MSCSPPQADVSPKARITQLQAALMARFPGAVQPLSGPIDTHESLPGLRPSPSNEALSSERPARSVQAHTTITPLAPPVREEPPIRHGYISEVIGPHGAGGCTLVLRHIADLLTRKSALQSKSTRYAIWIDLKGSLYPPALVALGVPLERLLLIQPTELQQALQAIEITLRGGAAYAIVLDVPNHTPPLRLGVYHRLRQRIRNTDCGLCILAPHSIAPTPYRLHVGGSNQQPALYTAQREAG